MANPAQTRRGTKLRILQGNGATPTEVFDAFCAMTAKEVNFQSQTNDFYTPDCENPDDPAWREIIKSGRSATVSGSGSLDIRDLSRYQSAYDNAESINHRVELDISNLTNGGYWAGAWMLTQLQITGNDTELVQVNMTLESDGAVTWVPAA